MQTTSRCAPWKIASYAENLVLQALQFEKMSVCRKFPGGVRIRHYGPYKCLVKV
jgi:hypothetical protein